MNTGIIFFGTIAFVIIKYGLYFFNVINIPDETFVISMLVLATSLHLGDAKGKQLKEILEKIRGLLNSKNE